MENVNKNCIVLLSSGLDSAVALYSARNRFDNIHCITFDYGQKARKEITRSRDLAKSAGAEHIVVQLPFLKNISSSSALVGNFNVPDVNHGPWNPEESAQQVWVPGRNLVFLSLAVAYAESIGGGTVTAGLNAEEGETFPDNSASFARSMRESVSIASSGKVDLWFPLINLKKEDIMSLAHELNVPLNLLWYCYRDLDEPCGKCESCYRFQKALENYQQKKQH